MNSRRDTQVDVDVSLRMRDRGWSRDCQQLPARRVAAHQQEDEIAQAVGHSDLPRDMPLRRARLVLSVRVPISRAST